LTPTLKSHAISLLLHAWLVAALYMIPASTIQRFSQTGQAHVVSIEATQGQPSPTSAIYLKPQLRPLANELDSPADRMVKTESIDPRKLTDAISEPQRSDAPELSLPASVPELPVDLQVMIKRRQPDETTPEVTILETPPRPRMKRPVVEAPAAAAIPIEQFVGLEKESTADLSDNRPPVYPLEAVRRRLEGVVLLQLKITDKGKVESVKLIKSSGHPILDDAAIDAVASWQGQPAKRWGRPVESIERLPVRFRL
jgi:protein TonB